MKDSHCSFVKSKKEIERPACFGKLDMVFPMGEDGLRSSPESCFPCHCKTECLRKAMEGKEGLQVREEKVDRDYSSGMIRFFDRWSQKKTIHRQRMVKDKKT